MIRTTLTLYATLIAAVAHAQLFSGPAVMTFGPSTQLGTIVNSSLGINNGPNSFTVSGFVDIQVPPGPQSGTLLEFIVDRPLNPFYLPAVSNMTTVTSLTGFSQPPGFSTFGPSSGISHTFFNQYPVVSQSGFSLSLVNGAATWAGTNTSPIFTYSTGGAQYVRQVFSLDGVITTGIGGIWKVDFPITSTVMIVPEPASLALFIGSFVGFVGWFPRGKRIPT
jgi:hypothetical protein